MGAKNAPGKLAQKTHTTATDTTEEAKDVQNVKKVKQVLSFECRGTFSISKRNGLEISLAF